MDSGGGVSREDMCEHKEEEAEREKEVVLDSEEDEETRVESARPFFRTERNVIGPSDLEASAGGNVLLFFLSLFCGSAAM